MFLLIVAGCASGADRVGSGLVSSPADIEAAEPGEPGEPGEPMDGDRFADRVVSFEPGPFSGFGADRLPDVVLGPPRGGGAYSGSLDVVSLGRGGSITLELVDIGLVDGPGPDLLVFENAFDSPAGRFAETGVVAVSDDGVHWAEFPCDPEDEDGGYPGCAGFAPTLTSPGSGIAADDPAVAGGDRFDLATVQMKTARFVRVRDTGYNEYGGVTGGFDLDAVVVVNGAGLPQGGHSRR